LAFSRKQVLEPQILNLNDVIKNTEKMLRRLIGEDVILTTLLNNSISNIKVDPGQIEQVIMNLAVNARDAMPKGGRLTIETSNVVLDKNHWKYDFEFVEGNYVMLTVTDTGCGMTQEVKERIFEPFFTTKEQGKGTGLGMATVFGIIRQSDGHISVYSEVGVGSTFKLYFPAIEENAITHESDVDDKYTMNGDETILLVEDETSVRDMAKITLESYGYKVLAANSGHKAINIVENYKDTIHLVVTDVVMPAMSGRELTEYLRHHYKNLKILFMSGYTDDAVVRHGIIEKEHAFLQKPFSPIALVKKVRELLDNNSKG
jgi:CheY-like chemotaxis protein